jgi:hypothetical protein
MTPKQSSEIEHPKKLFATGFMRDGHSRRRLALAIEAEWRKHVAGVVPAQPKARPEGQRPEQPLS